MATRRQILFSGAAAMAAGAGPVHGQTIFKEELPVRRAIAGAPTAVTAFVGRTASGPVAAPVRIASFSDFAAVFGSLSDAFPLSLAVGDFFNNGGETAIVLRLFVPDAGDGIARLSIGAVRLRASSAGVWGNTLTATIEAVTARRKSSGFTLRLRAAGRTETFLNLTLGDGPRRIDRVLATSSQLVRWDGDAPDQSLMPLPGASRADGGSDGTALTAADYTAGIGVLDATAFNLLCLPPDLAGGDVPAAVWQVAHGLCVTHRALLIADPPAAWRNGGDATAGLVATGLAGASNAVMNFPRLAGSTGSTVSSRVACGAIAGLYARTDVTRGVWAAPAGMTATLTVATDLAMGLNDMQTAALVTVNINPLRRFNGGPPLAFGARTLGSDPERRYINVVRTGQFIENSIRAGTAWAATAGNGPTAWAQLRLAVSAFMQDLFRKGAFAGTTAASAYYVQCDAATTSPADIAAGRIVLMVGFAPLRPAEFVLLRIVLPQNPA